MELLNLHLGEPVPLYDKEDEWVGEMVKLERPIQDGDTVIDRRDMNVGHVVKINQDDIIVSFEYGLNSTKTHFFYNVIAFNSQNN